MRPKKPLNPYFVWVTLLCAIVAISVCGSPVPSLAAAAVVRCLMGHPGAKDL